MSPVVPVGLGALDAALIAQAIYAVRDLDKKQERREALERERQQRMSRDARASNAPGRIRTCDLRSGGSALSTELRARARSV